MTTRLYHGTSYESFKQIKENGFGSHSKVWDCSYNDITYFWEPEGVGRSEGLEDEDEKHQAAIRNAIESAQIAAAFQGSRSDKVVVIVYETDENIYPDVSCEHMADHGAVEILEPKRTNIIGYYTSEYYPDLRLFYIKTLKYNQYFNMFRLPDILQKAIEVVPDEFHLYDLIEFKWEDDFHRLELID